MEPLTGMVGQHALIDLLWRVAVVVILLRVVLSWRRVRLRDRVGRWVEFITEPLLIPCRLLVDSRNFGFDISPLLAMIFLWLLRSLLIWVF